MNLLIALFLKWDISLSVKISTLSNEIPLFDLAYFVVYFVLDSLPPLALTLLLILFGLDLSSLDDFLWN